MSHDLIKILPIHKEFAHFIAEERKRGHDHVRKSHEDAGGDAANLSNDYWGALAEIALFAEIERQGGRPKYTLLSNRPPVGPDVASSRSFDVKASKPGSGYLMISKEAHESAHHPDWYVPVCFRSEEVAQVMMPIPHASVSGWKLIEAGPKVHCPFYSIERHKLTPLRVPVARLVAPPK